MFGSVWLAPCAIGKRTLHSCSRSRIWWYAKCETSLLGLIALLGPSLSCICEKESVVKRSEIIPGECGSFKHFDSKGVRSNLFPRNFIVEKI